MKVNYGMTDANNSYINLVISLVSVDTIDFFSNGRNAARTPSNATLLGEPMVSRTQRSSSKSSLLQHVSHRLGLTQNREGSITLVEPNTCVHVTTNRLFFIPTIFLHFFIHSFRTQTTYPLA
ncbi:hypothetical protein Hanom_Chr01g00056371 [Helianthus anomalus]